MRWIRPLNTGHIDRISGRDIGEIRKGVQELQVVAAGNGIDLKKTGCGLTIALAPWVADAVGLVAFVAKITGNTAADSPAKKRWLYSFSEVEKTAGGYGGWTAITTGRSGTTTTDPARNWIEDMNTAGAGSTYGNGVTHNNLDTANYTFAVQPCPANVFVIMYAIPYAGGTEYWFAYENGVDGTCD